MYRVGTRVKLEVTEGKLGRDVLSTYLQDIETMIDIPWKTGDVVISTDLHALLYRFPYLYIIKL